MGNLEHLLYENVTFHLILEFIHFGLTSQEETQTIVSTKDDSKDNFLNDFDWNLFEQGIETIKDDKLT